MPPLTQALYSKSEQVIACALRAVRCLAAVAPAGVFRRLTGQFIDDIQSVTHAARMHSALKGTMLTVDFMVHRRRHASGAALLLPFLGMCLPGIDATDMAKAHTTFGLLKTIFCSVPFIDARETDKLPMLKGAEGEDAVNEGGVYDDGDVVALHETADDARACTFAFSDWALAFQTAVLSFYENGDEMKKKAAAGGGAKRCIMAFYQVSAVISFCEFLRCTLFYSTCISSHHTGIARTPVQSLSLPDTESVDSGRRVDTPVETRGVNAREARTQAARQHVVCGGVCCARNVFVESGAAAV
jgi:hypothetical protein